MAKRPYVLGIGGTLRRDSTSERALHVALRAASAAGADVDVITGHGLDLPMYTPGESERTAQAQRLITAMRRCDGIIISTPAYHGSISGLIKNALDYAEDLRADDRSYFDGIAVGCIACGAGWQAAGQTLAALRAIAHALRGWPTPMGAAIASSSALFDAEGNCRDAAASFQLETIGAQVVQFAVLGSSRPVDPALSRELPERLAAT